MLAVDGASVGAGAPQLQVQPAPWQGPVGPGKKRFMRSLPRPAQCCQPKNIRVRKTEYSTKKTVLKIGIFDRTFEFGFEVYILPKFHLTTNFFCKKRQNTLFVLFLHGVLNFVFGIRNSESEYLKTEYLKTLVLYTNSVGCDAFFESCK